MQLPGQTACNATVRHPSEAEPAEGVPRVVIQQQAARLPQARAAVLLAGRGLALIRVRLRGVVARVSRVRTRLPTAEAASYLATTTTNRCQPLPTATAPAGPSTRPVQPPLCLPLRLLLPLLLLSTWRPTLTAAARTADACSVSGAAAAFDRRGTHTAPWQCHGSIQRCGSTGRTRSAAPGHTTGCRRAPGTLDTALRCCKVLLTHTHTHTHSYTHHHHHATSATAATCAGDQQQRPVGGTALCHKWLSLPHWL